MNRNINKSKNAKIILLIISFVLTSIFIVACGKKSDDKEMSMTTTIEEKINTEDSTDIIIATDTNAKTEIDEEGFVVVDDYYIVKDDVINVLNRPSEDGDIYRLLEKESIVNRIGYKDSWYKVIVDDDYFYINASGVAETKSPVDEQEKTEEETDIAGENKVNATNNGMINLDKKNKVIVIDPGNQMTINEFEESIGPNDEQTKLSSTVGSVGKITGEYEYEINLQIALYLKLELTNRGYQVVMTRETNDVNISNKERAEIANQANAAAFIRIDLVDSDDTSLSGAMGTIMKSDSPFNANCYQLSKRLASFVLEGVVNSTGGINNGIIETNEMTSINWSEIPVAVIGSGFISNATEEELLVTEEYQRKIAKGIADGIDGYYQ